MKYLVAFVIALLPSLSQAQALRFGYPGTPAGALAIVANSLNIWKKHDVDVDAIPQAAAVNVRDALVGGSLDIGFAGLSNFIVGVAAGAPLKAIGVAVDQCAASALVVKADAPYKTLADLKGRRIGSEFATVTHGSLLSGVLPKNQIGVREIHLVNVRFGDMISALMSGSVDAVTAVEPFLSQAENTGMVRIITDFCPYAPVPVVITTTNSTLKSKLDQERRFMAALLEVAQLFKDKPEEAAKIYGDQLRSKGFELPPEVVIQIIKRLNITPEKMKISNDLVQYTQDEASRMKASGQIDVVPDMASAVDQSLAK